MMGTSPPTQPRPKTYDMMAVTLEIPELIQFLVQELHDLPDDRKPGNNTKYQVEDAVELLQINYML